MKLSNKENGFPGLPTTQDLERTHLALRIVGNEIFKIEITAGAGNRHSMDYHESVVRHAVLFVALVRHSLKRRPV